jgi:hypothetical protein
MSPEAQTTIGLILLTVPTIQFGGYTLLQFLTRGTPGYRDNPLRRSMFTAGHAHAGVIVILSIIIQPLIELTALTAFWQGLIRTGTPLSAILISAGFFLSVASPGATRPNRLIYLIYIGALILAVSVLALGVGLLTV